MTIKSILVKAARSSCVVFSVIITVYSLLVLAFFDGVGMNPVSVFLFYPFSFFVTLAACIVKYTHFNGATKLLIHFLIFTLSVVLFIFLPYGSVFSPQNTFILFVIYCVIYAIIGGIFAAFKASQKRRNEKNTEYKNVY